MRKLLLALVIVFAATTLAAADTIYLRDGRTIQGTLLGFINGRFVVRVESRYATNDTTVGRGRPNDLQYFRPEEVERIEIEGRTLEDTRYQTRSVQVSLESNWTDSGVYVRRGERVQVSASGVITVGRNRITPDGLRSTDPTAPLPNVAEGKLIGAIGDDARAPIIELGSSREFVADRNGRLYLTANRGSYNDARGSFDVQIRRERNTSIADDRADPPGGVRTRERDRIDRNDRDRNTPSEIAVTVPGTSRGVDAGIEVRAGDQITISATGTIIAGRRIGEVGPDGARSSGFGSVVNARPVPAAGVGALIGYIRTATGQVSQPFLIGSNITVNVPADGRLMLAINDDDYSDNSGSFSVRIRY